MQRVGLMAAAAAALLAAPAHAETLTLSVIYGGQTFGFAGNAGAVTVDPATINADLAGSGYTFSNLGAFSDAPGSGGSVGGYLIDSATLIRHGGTGGVLTIRVAERGFTAPPGNLTDLSSAQASSFDGTTTSSYQQDTASIVTAAGTRSLATILHSNGGILDTHDTFADASLPGWTAPYNIRLVQSIALIQRSTNPAALSVSGVVSVLDAPAPEPSSLLLLALGLVLIAARIRRTA